MTGNLKILNYASFFYSHVSVKQPMLTYTHAFTELTEKNFQKGPCILIV